MKLKLTSEVRFGSKLEEERSQLVCVRAWAIGDQMNGYAKGTLISCSRLVRTYLIRFTGRYELVNEFWSMKRKEMNSNG